MRLRQLADLTLPPLLWASNAVLGRALGGAISPALLNAVRWVVATTLLAPLARSLWSAPETLKAHWRYYAVLGLLGMGCYNAMQYQALHTSSALNVTLIASSMPLWMLIVGALKYRVMPTARGLAGAVLSLVGVVLVVGHGSWVALLHVRLVTGDLLMMLAVFLWAIYSWMLARPPFAQRPPWDWAGTLMAQSLFGTGFALLIAGGEGALGQTVFAASPMLWAALLYVAVGPALLAYRCWGAGVAEAGPAMAALFFNLTPAFAALMSALLLGEGPAWFHVAAFVLIVAGIGVSMRR